MNPIIVIPSRLASTRLPGKPLADIHGKPMIVHVLDRAREADIGPVAVACADQEIADVVRQAGGTAVMTDPSLPSGSDRVHAALATLDPQGVHDVVVNLQGDLPTIPPAQLRAVITPLSDPAIDIATLVAPILEAAEALLSSVVKAACAFDRGRGGVAGVVFLAGADPRRRTDRCGIISAFMPIVGRRWRASSRCRKVRWNAAKSSNSCVRWRPACALPAPASTTRRSASTPATTSSAPA